MKAPTNSSPSGSSGSRISSRTVDNGAASLDSLGEGGGGEDNGGTFNLDGYLTKDAAPKEHPGVGVPVLEVSAVGAVLSVSASVSPAGKV